MPFLSQKYLSLNEQVYRLETTIIAVSKTKPVEDILEAYEMGIRDFGENYVQELVEKQAKLPKDIRWHFIGHLQSNKVKYIADFVHLIHGVDSEKLLTEINKQGKKLNKKINCLLQVHIAEEETKFGFDKTEIDTLINLHFINKESPHQFEFVKICGMMGMASFSEDIQLIKNEFKFLKTIFDTYSNHSTANFKLEILSMGMSADYQIAIECGSNMIRIGSMLFGERNYSSNKNEASS